MGGWRIIKTMGSRIIKMDTAQGFAAQGSGAAVILAATHVGFPLSTTHTISGGVMGAGAAKRVSAVRWGVAGIIVIAWVLTLPAAALIGGVTYGVHRLFGTGSAGSAGRVRRAGHRGRPWSTRGGCAQGSAITAAEGEMSLLADPIVDWGELLKVIWPRCSAGSACTAAFAVALFGAIRATEPAATGTIGLAAGYGVLRRWPWRWCGQRRVRRRRDDQQEVGQPCSRRGARQASSSSSVDHAPTAARTSGVPGRLRTPKPFSSQAQRRGLGVGGLPRDERRVCRAARRSGPAPPGSRARRCASVGGAVVNGVEARRLEHVQRGQRPGRVVRGREARVKAGGSLAQGAVERRQRVRDRAIAGGGRRQLVEASRRT